jgi:5'-AMP-activated protein kinase catalytic alpha subunit
MGIVLFVMLCGYLPFHHKNTQALYKLIFAGKFEIPPEISN